MTGFESGRRDCGRQVVRSGNRRPVVRAIVLDDHRELGEAVTLAANRTMLVYPEQVVSAVIHSRAFTAPAAVLAGVEGAAKFGVMSSSFTWAL